MKSDAKKATDDGLFYHTTILGRRRIGKTFLIDQYFKKQLCFELIGQKNGTLKEQLSNFDQALTKRTKKQRTCPSSWQEAFQQLEAHLRGLRGQGKRVIFLDELIAGGLELGPGALLEAACRKPQ